MAQVRALEQSAAASSAVQVWQPRDVELLIAQYPEDRFNALFPRKVMSQVNPMLAPVMETVVLNPDPQNGGDVYRSDDLKQGHVALTKVALRRLMALAGVSVVDSRRMDDGSDPWYVLWQVTVEMFVPGRTRPDRAIGSKEIRLSGDSVKGWSTARLAKAREHMIRMAESKAANAAIRDLLTLRSSYSAAELSRPFAVLRWEPNMNHPAVAERFLDNLLPATTAVYGAPPEDIAQLPVGDAGYELAPHVQDDDITEGRYVEVRTNGHATVDTTTGEVVAERGAEPDWGLDGGLDFGEPGPVSLADRLAATADGFAATGPLTDAQKGLLRPLLGPLGNAPVQAGIRAAFGLPGLGQLQERHGAAIIGESERMGADAFREAWRAMAAGGAA